MGQKSKGVIPKGTRWKEKPTIRDVTKAVTISLSPITGPIVEGWGNTKMGTVGCGSIKRNDFGVSWNNTLDEGRLVVGKEVKIILDLQLIQKKSATEWLENYKF